MHERVMRYLDIEAQKRAGSNLERRTCGQPSRSWYRRIIETPLNEEVALVTFTWYADDESRWRKGKRNALDVEEGEEGEGDVVWPERLEVWDERLRDCLEVHMRRLSAEMYRLVPSSTNKQG